MVDFINIEVVDADQDFLLSCGWLEWKEVTDRKTGEVLKQYASFNNLDIIIIRKKGTIKVFVKGSIHKYYNIWKTGIDQNHNDFTHRQFIDALINLCGRFMFDPKKMHMHSFEFGVNVPVNNPDDILKDAIIHKNKQFDQEYEKSKYCRECSRDNYSIKIYNKTKEQGEGGLRFEIKIKKMVDMAGKVSTVYDLLDIEVMKYLGGYLHGEFINILFYDRTINHDELTPSQAEILLKGRSPAFWDDLQKGEPDDIRKINRMTFKRTRELFENIIKEKGKDQVTTIVGNMISDKWSFLMNDTLPKNRIEEICYKFTTFKKVVRNEQKVVRNDGECYKFTLSKGLICNIGVDEEQGAQRQTELEDDKENKKNIFELQGAQRQTELEDETPKDQPNDDGIIYRRWPDDDIEPAKSSFWGNRRRVRSAFW